MNKDLVIGILVSLFLHAGILGGEYLFPKARSKPPAANVERETLMEMELPPDEPEETKEVDELLDEEVQNVMAPPSLVDMPTVVPVDAFTQQITPPPPPGLPTDKSAISIPVIKPGSSFGKGIKDLFNPADLDQQVQLRVPVNPVYPSDLKRQGISGEVLVEFIVDSNGNVTAAQILKSSHREFEAPSLQAVAKWKFRPGKKGGRAVNVRAQQLLQFTPTDD